jgi:hypothetical protein
MPILSNGIEVRAILAHRLSSRVSGKDSAEGFIQCAVF